MHIVTESFKGRLITASTNVQPGPGALGGIFCSTGSATVTVYDDAATGTTSKLVETFTPVAGTFTPLPFEFVNGCYIVISGTGTFTVATRQL
jgi:hypothetical protein